MSSLRLVIVGLPKSGKTTVFNALTRAEAKTSAYSTGVEDEPNLASVKVPDERLDRLTALFKPKRSVPADVQYVDVAGLAKGVSEKGIGGALLGHLAQANALVHVVRAFEDPNVPHPEETVDPLRDIETLQLEFTFNDLGQIEKRLVRLESQIQKVRGAEREQYEREQAALIKLQGRSRSGDAGPRGGTGPGRRAPAARLRLPDRQAAPRPPQCRRGPVGRSGERAHRGRPRRSSPGPASPSMRSPGRSRWRSASWSRTTPRSSWRRWASRRAGWTASFAARIALLGLISFFTVGPDECRAWTITRGTVAQQAAGEIHSDIERGFIRAEVVAYDALIAAGSMADAKKAGTHRLEGKQYIVQDGDIIEFLFNV